MKRRIAYICAAVVLLGLITGICVYRIQAKNGFGHLGKEIIYFGDSSEDTSGDAPPEDTEEADGEEKQPSAEKEEFSEEEGQTAEATVTPEATEEPYPVIKTSEKLKMYDSTGTVVAGDTGFELYNYVESSASRYAKAINKFTKEVDQSVSVYEMVIPTSVGITFPDNKVKKINSSDQKEALEKIEKKLSGRERFISLYDVMMRHRDEYIYFRTDHHWTQLGAYYAYTAFCQEKGLEANPVTAYEKKVSEGFLGSIYVDADKNPDLRQDDVEMYYPVSKHLQMQYKDSENRYKDGAVISDPTNFGISGKYLAFLCGDNPYTLIVNNEKQDGSSCIVVKESFGNAFVPFLADHYERIYVIDYRYWDGNLKDLVKTKRAKEVLFLNNISMTRNAYLIGMLAKIL
ncbi:MAG: hypothetical protein IJ733_04605 [Lachnospiraceae bacterium]|nr:hypothetical protein [Lachnospiraceae bacterium]